MNDATARFEELVNRPDSDIPLDECAFLIAAHAYPGLDVAAELGRLDDIAAGCTTHTLDGLRHHLFEVLGFSGNTRRWADPRNSFLNDVIERRTGLPISLAVVTIEVGRRVDVPLVGIGMPGRFLVGDATDRDVVLDPFSGGRILDAENREALFRSVFGESASLEPSMLAPVGHRAILTRILANLRQLYLATGDAPSVGWVLRLRALIPATAAAEMADVAAAQAALGRFAEAASTLEELADALGDPAAERARAEAKRVRSRLN
ncbi:MAG: transglutaminase-like domain-containing protein [Actinomycetota bacterium]|nr:transglutaminase-like domain-containing protein [Actinomycetota bacterium]